MKKYVKIALFVIVALIFVGTFAFLYNKSKPKEVKYEIYKATVSDLEKSTVATGTIVPRDEILIKPQISGIISDIYKHECLGHGSGKLLPNTDPDALKAYSSTLEEARADLFGLYYLGDAKLVELKLVPDAEAYKAEYYKYIMNGLITQLVRIEPGKNVEEAHMRNRQLIAKWVYEKGKADKVIELKKRDDKTYVVINDYQKLRTLFGSLLAEVQRIKSEGDYAAGKRLVEDYGVKVDQTIHAEILTRYAKLHLAPYKGFVNPVMKEVRNKENKVTDVVLDYSENYIDQMMRYSRDYSFLPSYNE